MNPSGTTQKPKLLDQLRQAIRTRHYSIRTEQAYVQWARRYILFHNKRHPLEMDAAEINAYLTHLANDRRVSASTQNQALCAILFLYKQVLTEDPRRIEDLVRAKRPRNLPVVLTRNEVAAVLGQMSGVHWIMGNLLYGSGLRLIECLRLRVKDIDFGYSHGSKNWEFLPQTKETHNFMGVPLPPPNPSFISSPIENSSVIGCGIADFTDMDCIYSRFAQQFCCRSWQSLMKQQFHG